MKISDDPQKLLEDLGEMKPQFREGNRLYPDLGYIEVKGKSCEGLEVLSPLIESVIDIS